MKLYHAIAGKEVGAKIAEAFGLDPGRVRRIVLDIGIENPIIAYVELIGDKRLLQIDWTSLYGATIEAAPVDD